MVIKEYLAFLKEYKVVGLALAVIMGTAATALVNSLVKDIVMPFITPFVAADSWREATLALGPVTVRWGAFCAEALNFIILGAVVFLVAKKILKEERVGKK